MMNILFRTLLFLMLSSSFFSLYAQGPMGNTLRIAIFSEGRSTQAAFFEDFIKEEIRALLGTRYQLVFDVEFASGDLGGLYEKIERVYREDRADIVIASGIISSTLLLRRGDYPIPTIAGIVVREDVTEIVPFTDEGTSGVSNFTYLESPFDIARDLEVMHQIYPYQKLAVIGEPLTKSPLLKLREIFKTYLPEGVEFIIQPVQPNPGATIDSLSEDVDAAYLLPVFDSYDDSEIGELVQAINDRGLISFSLIDDPYLSLGGYGAYSSTEKVQKIPRRIALSVMKIVEGEDPKNLPVRIKTYTDNLILNAKTAGRINIYADWELIGKSTLINVGSVYTDQEISISAAIFEALDNNLDFQIQQKQTQISERNVDVARSNYLPQISGTATYSLTDRRTAENSFGSQGTNGNLTTGGSITQLLVNEPAIANIAIEKLLLESQQQAQLEQKLDIILEVAQAYLGVLQAEAFLRLQNENLAVTRKNYDIAQTKEQIGQSSTSDVYRWESQLANNNIELNNALAQLQQSRYNLNRILNRPIDQEWSPIEVPDSDSILQILDGRLFAFLENQSDLNLLADFLVLDGLRRLPELKQVDLSKAAQERSLLSQKRSFFLPTIAASGGLNYVIDRFDPVLPPEGFPQPIDDPTWNVGVNLQLPIFQGMSRRYQVDQTKVGIMQLEDQKANLQNLLEQQIRTNLSFVSASFNNVILSRQSAEAARLNFQLVQDNYSEGIVNITSLIDAQNAALQAEISAINSVYQLLIDIFTLERSSGLFLFVATPQEKNDFFNRFLEYRATRQ